MWNFIYFLFSLTFVLVDGWSLIPECGKHIPPSEFELNILINVDTENSFGCTLHPNNESIYFGKLFASNSRATNDEISYIYIFDYYYNDDKNKIIHFADEILQKFLHLKILIFESMGFQDINATTFSKGSLNLEELRINDGGIEELRGNLFEKLPNLKSLQLNKNGLVTIDENAFVGLTKLEVLDLSLNYLKKLGNFMEPLSNLKKLILTDNKIIRLRSNFFEPLTNLEELALDSNQIMFLEDINFKNNKKLVSMDFGDNQIEHISETLINDFKNLKKLDLSNNYCVDQLFDYYEIPKNSENILRTILYPFCNLLGEKEQKEETFDWVEILIITIAIIIILMIITCITCSLCDFKKAKNSEIIDRPGVNDEDTIITEAIIDYTDQSTVHGVRYLGERERHWTEKSFWLPVFLISVCIASYCILQTYRKWKDSPVIMGFDSKAIDLQEIPFPAITICSENKIDNGSLSFEKMLHPNDSYLFFFLDALSQICPNIYAHNIQNYMENPHDDDDDFKNGYYNYYLQQSALKPVSNNNFKWKGHKGRNAFYFAQTMTDVGFCSSFNLLDSADLFWKDDLAHDFIDALYGEYADSLERKITGWDPEIGYTYEDSMKTYPVRLRESDANLGFQLQLSLSEKDLRIPCENGTEGYKILLHHPTDWPFLSKNFIQISHNHKYTIVIKPQVTKTSPALNSYKYEDRQCYLPNEYKLKYFKIYSKSNCEIECLTEYTKRLCGCVPFYMPRSNNNDERICIFEDISCINIARKSSTIGKLKLKSESEKCRCLPACDSVEYKFEISQANLKIEPSSKNKKDVQVVTELNAYFESDQIIVLLRSELYGFLDFIGNIGGLLGLFMGISILSFFEMFYHFTLRAVCTKAKKDNEKPVKTRNIKPTVYRSGSV